MGDLFCVSPVFVKSTEALRNAGAIADFVICVIWRGSKQDNSLEKAGIQKLPLFDMEELSAWMQLS
ncbi:MAG: hypothetical protein V7K90_20950 [Nostoc sp.]|uniref:hypothetical protein n=1 Tax=Nostoc sp. TaxID=1180 RepID=UPI002FF5575D